MGRRCQKISFNLGQNTLIYWNLYVKLYYYPNLYSDNKKKLPNQFKSDDQNKKRAKKITKK